MIYGVFCIRDAKTGFMTPTVDLNADSAIRNFAHSLLAAPSVVTTFSQDFDLYQLGSFDSQSGDLVPCATPSFVVSGHDALALARSSSGGDDRA